jgi:hypothetical protein
MSPKTPKLGGFSLKTCSIIMSKFTMSSPIMPSITVYLENGHSDSTLAKKKHFQLFSNSDFKHVKGISDLLFEQPSRSKFEHRLVPIMNNILSENRTDLAVTP